MKKVFLIIVVALFSLNAFSQGLVLKEKINTNDLIGYWKSEEESTQLFFWKDSLGILQTQEISATSGEPLDLITLRINEDSIFIKTIFTPNDWITENIFTFVDKITLKCVVDGKIKTTLIYTKVK
jgi:hypothetical protein